MRVIKLSLSLFFIIFLLNRFFSINIALYAAAMIITVFIIFRKKIQVLYDKIENRFIRNLNDRELQEELKQFNLMASKRDVTMAPWDAHMITFEVEPEITSSILGKTLEELQWREKIGINIAMIKRGQLSIPSPQRTERIFPGDRLFIICTDAQEIKMNAILRPNRKQLEGQQEVEMELDKFTLSSDSPFIQRTIRESGIRAATNGLVVGVERNGERLLNPASDFLFEEGDVVWIVGEKKLINTIG